MDLKPGDDRGQAEARFDELIAQFIAEGPSEDELRRAVTGAVRRRSARWKLSATLAARASRWLKGSFIQAIPRNTRPTSPVPPRSRPRRCAPPCSAG